LHYGTGVFEGIRCYSGVRGAAIFRLDEHLNRLSFSARTCGIEIPFSNAEIGVAIRDLVSRNDFSDCYIRPICFYGSAVLGLNPAPCPVETVILAWPWDTYLGASGLERGVRITVSPWRKFQARMAPTAAKACGQYINSVLALRDALSRGFAEALLLDADGSLAEGSGENLFIVSRGKVITNSEQNSILPGITRDSVLRIARDLGYEVEIKQLLLDDLTSADEAFFTGTAAEVTPISEVDGAIIGHGQRGPITEIIQRVFFSATQGRQASYEGWLSPVSLLEPKPLLPEASSLLGEADMI
jgi:branched-chain amino acid aminotransferase